MKKSGFLLLTILAIAVVFTTSDVVVAQPPPPALPSGPTQAPIDGGLSLLALGGGAYALKRLRARR